MRSLITAAAALFAGSSLLSPSVRARPVRQSKHSTRFGKGRVRIGPASGLRKLMRAARRGLVPQDRLFTIEHAMRNAAARAHRA